MALIFNKYLKQILLENNIFGDKDKVIQDLTNFLEGDLKPYAKDFVGAGYTYGVDPYLMASIAMLETGRGKAPVLTKHKNISGKWDPQAKTHATYSDLKDSIYDQAKFLKSGYIDKGLTTISAIGAKYAPPGASNDPNNTNKDWPKNVASFYNQATGGKFNELATNGAFPVDSNMPEQPEQQVQSTDFKSPLQAIAGLGKGYETLAKAIRGGI